MSEYRTALDACWLDDFGHRVFDAEKVQADHDRIRKLEHAFRWLLTHCDSMLADIAVHNERPGGPVEGPVVESFKAGVCRARDERIAELEGCISRLLLSADATWEEQRMGHDWAEAVAEARAALAGKEEPHE